MNHSLLEKKNPQKRKKKKKRIIKRIVEKMEWRTWTKNLWEQGKGAIVAAA